MGFNGDGLPFEVDPLELVSQAQPTQLGPEFGRDRTSLTIHYLFSSFVYLKKILSQASVFINGNELTYLLR
ncbi:unnamed protein product [Dovyalis caffra]|uniref:Uncharacterized protein n=1 Tax=Dovyalis caffra TaxID=77055 RepID=A0AAV1S3B1_9ROSI|nr:unnamed protein product [Dovyalis caffra]